MRGQLKMRRRASTARSRSATARSVTTANSPGRPSATVVAGWPHKVVFARRQNASRICHELVPSSSTPTRRHTMRSACARLPAARQSTCGRRPSVGQCVRSAEATAQSPQHATFAVLWPVDDKPRSATGASAPEGLGLAAPASAPVRDSLGSDVELRCDHRTAFPRAVGHPRGQNLRGLHAGKHSESALSLKGGYAVMSGERDAIPSYGRNVVATLSYVDVLHVGGGRPARARFGDQHKRTVTHVKTMGPLGVRVRCSSV